MKISRIFLYMAITLSLNAYANICVELGNFETKNYSFTDNIQIRSFDNTKLAANIFIPKNNSIKSPAVIFANSWALDEHEYFQQAKTLADKGYIVLSYSTRGFGCSEGVINVVGKKDLKDLKYIINWLEENTKVDVKNIGMSGISYGAGMSLMGLAHDERIKTVVAMSGWTSLTDALYGEKTPRKFWASLLIVSGFLTGRLDNEVPKLFSNLVEKKDIDKTICWASERSPINYIQNINKFNKPVFISQNYGDNLFQPNPIIKFYNKLTSPKLLDLNQGTHGTAEITGLFKNSNYSYKRMQEWFDHWLKGEKLKSIKLNTISMQTDHEHKREYFGETFFNTANSEKLYLKPKSLFKNNMNSLNDLHEESSEYIISTFDSFATTGIPLVSSILDGNFKVPVYSYVPFVRRKTTFQFKSDVYEQGLSIRGIPKVNVTIVSDEKEYQLIAYLYDITPLGYSKLITHGVFSTLSREMNASFELVATAYDLPEGHRLALVIDTKDNLYSSVEDVPQLLELKFKGGNNTLVLPTN